MKILMIHNFHRKGSASGDDEVFRNEKRLLEENGNQIVEFVVNNDLFDNANILKKILYTMGMFWSFKSYAGVCDIIRKENPDIVHVHTFFPLLSPSVLYAAKRSGKKVVATLHDTRLICPCAVSLRDNKTCDLCGDGRYFRMAKYKCYKGSRLQSLIVAMVFKYHRVKRTFYKQIDRYICLNDNQIRQLKEIGFSGDKIIKKYNFVRDTANMFSEQCIEGLPERYVVYYGRLGVEKGIQMLQSIWEKLPGIPLVVMGGGPLEKEFEEWAKKHSQIIYLGYVKHEKCLNIVRQSQFVVFPSICYEGCSMVVIETESLGKPIVATDLGFAREAIDEGKNGLKIPLGNVKKWVEVIKKLWNDSEKIQEMGINARKDYEKKYMPIDNYERLINIYRDLI